MNKNRINRFLVASWVAVLLVLEVSCTSKPVKQEESLVSEMPPLSAAPAADENTLGDSDSGKSMGIRTVNFAYDSSKLDEDSKTVLKTNADILKKHERLHVQVEGHCDQRGGVQYNIALGERRAKAVRNYLKDLGVSDSRLTVISFGKERLVDESTTEEAYAKNRRANFAITSHE